MKSFLPIVMMCLVKMSNHTLIDFGYSSSNQKEIFDQLVESNNAGVFCSINIMPGDVNTAEIINILHAQKHQQVELIDLTGINTKVIYAEDEDEIEGQTQKRLLEGTDPESTETKTPKEAEKTTKSLDNGKTETIQVDAPSNDVKEVKTISSNKAPVPAKGSTDQPLKIVKINDFLDDSGFSLIVDCNMTTEAKKIKRYVLGGFCGQKTEAFKITQEFRHSEDTEIDIQNFSNNYEFIELDKQFIGYYLGKVQFGAKNKVEFKEYSCEIVIKSSATILKTLVALVLLIFMR